MNNWVWVEDDVAFMVHDELLGAYGGLVGVKDQGAVLSVMARAQNLAGYGQPDVADLAAEYLFGFARTQCFNDGNKRTAWTIAATFLDLNGASIALDYLQAEGMVVAVSENRMSWRHGSDRESEHIRRLNR